MGIQGTSWYVYLSINRQSERVHGQDGAVEPPHKKKKRFGQEFESGDLSDEYDKPEDEIDKYLSMHIDPELIVDNPLYSSDNNIRRT